MKKIFLFLLIGGALVSFSCNKYCNCKQYIDGDLNKDYKDEFVIENKDLSCSDYDDKQTLDGKVYEIKCK